MVDKVKTIQDIVEPFGFIILNSEQALKFAKKLKEKEEKVLTNE